MFLRDISRRRLLKASVQALAGGLALAVPRKAQAEAAYNPATFKPLKWVGRIFDERTSARGTGFLVGPRIVLTAAHVLYNPVRDTDWPSSLTFYPAYSSLDGVSATSLSGFSVVRWNYGSQWPRVAGDRSHPWRTAYDWALLLLDQYPNIGYFGYASHLLQPGSPIYKAGYPRGASPRGSQKLFQTAVTAMDEFHIWHPDNGQAEWTRGMSGGPIWYGAYPGWVSCTVPADFYAVGIHSATGRWENSSRHRRIDENLRNLIDRWRRY